MAGKPEVLCAVHALHGVALLARVVHRVVFPAGRAVLVLPQVSGELCDLFKFCQSLHGTNC
jgi:hypothetical protein